MRHAQGLRAVLPLGGGISSGAGIGSDEAQLPSSSSSSSAAASSSAVASAARRAVRMAVPRARHRGVCVHARRSGPRRAELPHLRPALGHQLVDVQPVGAEGSCEGCCQPIAASRRPPTPPAPPEGVAAAVRTPVEARRPPIALAVHSAEALDLLRRPARIHQPARHSPLD